MSKIPKLNLEYDQFTKVEIAVVKLQMAEEQVLERIPGVQKETWIPLALSFVEYQKGDFLGFLFAISSLSLISFHMSFITLILFRRDLLTLCFYAGFTVNGPLNEVLKCIFKQPRPRLDRRQFGKYGMPSSHAQHSWFFAAFGILFVIVRLPEGNPLENGLLIVMLLLMAVIVSYGRVYLGYHTSFQVVVGGCLGSILGAGCFLSAHYILAPWFPLIVSWPISQYFLIRDASPIQHLLQFEYNRTVDYTLNSC